MSATIARLIWTPSPMEKAAFDEAAMAAADLRSQWASWSEAPSGWSEARQACRNTWRMTTGGHAATTEPGHPYQKKMSSLVSPSDGAINSINLSISTDGDVTSSCLIDDAVWGLVVTRRFPPW